MSVHAYKTGDGTRWQVRWREATGKVRARSFTSKREANAFDAEVKARKFKGEALPRPGRESLAAAYDEWFRLRGSTLAPATQSSYRAVWNAHVRDRFDHHRLSELGADPQLFEELTAEMRGRGVGNAAQRRVLAVMSAVLTAAVDWKKIPSNPLWRMRKPPATPQRYPRPFPPVVLERIRWNLSQRKTLDPTYAREWSEALFVELMAYAGLRPGEALALTWADVGEQSIAIDKALRDGVRAPTKTGRARTVPLAEPLRDDLTHLSIIGRERDSDPIVPSYAGGYWTESQFRNWRQRVWKPMLKQVAGGNPRYATARPYDCRGSFVSLHLRAGASPLEVAKWAGHSPAVMFAHYANVIEELRGEPVLAVEEQITRARNLVETTAAAKLDRIVEDLADNPTVASGGEAALVLYGERPPALPPGTAPAEPG